MAEQSEAAVSGSAHDMLRIYLNDHLTGVVAGAQLADRVAHANASKPTGRDLSLIAAQIHEDHEALVGIMRDLGVRPQRTFAWLGRAGEKAGRLKPNGRILRRSALTGLVEIEALRLSVLGTAQAWRVLAKVAEHDHRVSAEALAALERKAEREAEILESIHLSAAAAVVHDQT